MEHLEEAFRLEREGEDFPLRVPYMLRGFVDQLGPCYERVDREDWVRRIRGAAMNVGAEELPSPQDLRGYWHESFGRF
ncbi:hypothetical protein VT03_11130 [Planctomyces sp. SH-PL14]|nr:hypothetical protein VT03_11130 [Planctomyces sp. SH-PL14]